MELQEMPWNSSIIRKNNRCVITGRARGKKRRWRISRFVFRHLADYNKLSGVTRAWWWCCYVWTVLFFNWLVNCMWTFSRDNENIISPFLHSLMVEDYNCSIYRLKWAEIKYILLELVSWPLKIFDKYNHIELLF